ncbi:MAG: hypothetical protein ACSHX6_03660 [Akkermansiaceae bacterium]
MKLYMKYKSVKHSVREYFSHSATGVKFLSWFGSWRSGLVKRDSRICIEAYPRSANTYSVAAFKISQDDMGSHIARHSHMAGQVKLALNYEIPCLVVIREPLAAASSLAVFAPYLSVKQCLKSYIQFYQSIWADRDRFVCVKFETVVESYDQIIQQLNKKYSLDLKGFESNDEMEKSCFELVEEMDRIYSKSEEITPTKVARPNEDRTKLNEVAKQELKQEKYKNLLFEAQELYEKYLEYIEGR